MVIETQTESNVIEGGTTEPEPVVDALEAFKHEIRYDLMLLEAIKGYSLAKEDYLRAKGGLNLRLAQYGIQV